MQEELKKINAKSIFLYIGGFQLPDKNAAAQRVLGIAKGLRKLSHNVVFLNSLKEYDKLGVTETEYLGFRCLEYKRESDHDYLVSAKTTLTMMKQVQPDVVIAYNYPAIALSRILTYCNKNRIKCFADVTEWYDTSGVNIVTRIIKGFDTSYRMKHVQKRLDGAITISKFLYDYYNKSVKTVLIPPTVDLEESKWNICVKEDDGIVSFVYAGVPSVRKERLNLIVSAVGTIENVKNVRLDIVGITREQFIQMYSWHDAIPKSVVFWGVVDHQKVLRIVGQSDWAIILRENNRTVKAGFPTKLVESISCGTPVIANRFSNVFDYLTEKNSICVENMDEITSYILQACEQKCAIDRNVFDYHNFLQELEELLR